MYSWRTDFRFHQFGSLLVRCDISSKMSMLNNQAKSLGIDEEGSKPKANESLTADEFFVCQQRS